MLIFFSGCVKYFDIPEVGTRKVTVNGLLIAGEKPIITVKNSYLASDTVPIILDNNSLEHMITDATVVLYSDSNEVDTLKFSDSIVFQGFILKGYTTDSLIPTEGSTYHLVVNVPDYGVLTASTTVPSSPKLDTVIKHADTSMYYSDVIVDVVIDDSCVTPEYYFFSAYAPYYTEDPNCITFSQNLLLPDKSFNGTPYTLTLTVDHHLSELYFYKANSDLGVYIQSLYNQVRERNFNDFPNPFQEPVVVYCNIQNGTGIFAALSKPIVINLNSRKK